jgi:hypothetical protein
MHHAVGQHGTDVGESLAPGPAVWIAMEVNGRTKGVRDFKREVTLKTDRTRDRLVHV